MTKRKVTEVVYEEDFPCIPEKPSEFIEWWEGKIALIPEEHRDTGNVEIDTFNSYGSTSIEVVVSYTREETDKEYSTRLAEENSKQVAREQRELAEYERLKGKFGEVWGCK